MGSVTTGRVRHADQLGVELPVPIRVTEYRLRHGHSQNRWLLEGREQSAVGCVSADLRAVRRGRPGRRYAGADGPSPGSGRQPRLRRQLHPAQVLLAAAGLSPTRALPPPWRPSTPRRWAHLRLAWRSRSASVVASAAAASASARSASARRWACSARLARALAAATCPAASLVTDSICASAASVSPTMVSLPDVSRSRRRPDGDPPVGQGRHRSLHQPVLGLPDEVHQQEAGEPARLIQVREVAPPWGRSPADHRRTTESPPNTNWTGRRGPPTGPETVTLTTRDRTGGGPWRQRSSGSSSSTITKSSGGGWRRCSTPRTTSRLSARPGRWRTPWPGCPRCARPSSCSTFACPTATGSPSAGTCARCCPRPAT